MICEESELRRSSDCKDSADYEDCEDSLDCLSFYLILMAPYCWWTYYVDIALKIWNTYSKYSSGFSITLTVIYNFFKSLYFIWIKTKEDIRTN